MIILSDAALHFFEQQFQRHHLPYCGITLKKIGCSGYQYHLAWVNEMPWDTLLPYNQWFLSYDPEWLTVWEHLRIDIQTDTLLQKKIVYQNPKTQAFCGCGESFSVVNDAK